MDQAKQPSPDKSAASTTSSWNREGAAEFSMQGISNPGVAINQQRAGRNEDHIKAQQTIDTHPDVSDFFSALSHNSSNTKGKPSRGGTSTANFGGSSAADY
eukprot:GEZU01038942.1.p1 GENE.GEZU01038942.1~~GEZU01038942.1.p1  ORF type:complete len:101 (-),score=18.49 GEZU01038942.1:35-337(-)